MPDIADWIKPTEAERLVAVRMGLAHGGEEVRAALNGWINDDRILMYAAQVIRWESRYYRSYRMHWEPEPPLDQSEQVDVSFRFSELPGGRLESSKFWSLAELTVWHDQANQQARVVYAGIRLSSPDIQVALELSGYTAESSAVSTAAAERECEEWLRSAFADDPKKKRNKPSFQEEATTRFEGRLSVRGFNRAWDVIAPQYKRTKPGRKS